MEKLLRALKLRRAPEGASLALAGCGSGWWLLGLYAAVVATMKGSTEVYYEGYYAILRGTIRGMGYYED